ncbi:MerR family transcriptional regulator [Yinghuangia sp. ASG 101]|uniref:MerR family transcriptional regulator n=1 Tax=Yinghuangia sp. ASG 101 TaxID=2896848 RepID=UPI001E2C9804|nr:MerR family transcriptional regulator [Yinghuangia sp. ASG 101]UGQ11640.1 MerR family transcriptional regulator [Yinghuangia sp. ASG 101]
MRISALSAASGVPTPTIKYYLREGLLPAGEPTGRNQAQYGPHHLHRLRLIRALLDVGGLSVASAKDTLAALDDPDKSVHKVLGSMQYALPTAATSPGDDASRQAEREVDALFERRRWSAELKGNPAREALVSAVAAFIQLGQEDYLALLDHYADAASVVADAEIAFVSRREDLAHLVESAAVATVLGDAVFCTLRRLAQEHTSQQYFAPGPGDDQDTEAPEG